MAQLKGKVLAGKVLVKPHEAEAKTASGIIIPDSAKEKPRQGKVVLVGAAKKDEEMEVKKGDVVLCRNIQSQRQPSTRIIFSFHSRIYYSQAIIETNKY
jgi:co-chaperonin GroES (HSP10)